MKTLYSLLFIFICKLAFAQVPSYVPTNNLTAWYGFNGNSNDESGNNINGTTVNNPTLTTDRFGTLNSAFEFGGSGDFIDYGDVDQFEGTSELSFSVWFNAYDFGGDSVWNQSRPILSKWYTSNDPNDPGTWNFLIYRDSLWFTFSDGINSESVRTPITFQTNEWVHIVCTYQSGAVKAFQNGVEVLSANVTSTSLNNSIHNFSIGDWFYDQNSVYNTFYGKIDDVGLWNRALDTCEVLNLYLGAPCDLGIKIITNNEKELVKIVDLIGRETEYKPNTPLIYIYSDGTRERIISFE